MNRDNAMRPGIFEGVFIVSQMKGEFYLGTVPIFIQKYCFPIAAWFIQLSGLTKNIATMNRISE
jgi:hypothetical protein